VTLIETVIAILIVAIAAVSIMGAMARANVASGHSMVQSQAADIANAYLTEIIGRPFADPDGHDSESQRQQYDDVYDYNGLTDVGARDATGTRLPGGDDYTVGVNVASSSALSGVSSVDAYLVTVTVTDPAGASTVTSGYRLR
jgi:MSHA pilin protein MshD